MHTLTSEHKKNKWRNTCEVLSVLGSRLQSWYPSIHPSLYLWWHWCHSKRRQETRKEMCSIPGIFGCRAIRCYLWKSDGISYFPQFWGKRGKRQNSLDGGSASAASCSLGWHICVSFLPLISNFGSPVCHSASEYAISSRLKYGLTALPDFYQLGPKHI